MQFSSISNHTTNRITCLHDYSWAKTAINAGTAKSVFLAFDCEFRGSALIDNYGMFRHLTN